DGAVCHGGGLLRRFARLCATPRRQGAGRARKGAAGRQDAAPAGRDSEQQGGEAHLREIRGRGRQAAALGLHDEGGQVLRGDCRLRDGEGGEGRADHEGGRSEGRQGAGRRDGEGQAIVGRRGLRGGEGQQWVPRGGRDAHDEE